MSTNYHIPAARETLGVLSMMYGDGLVVEKNKEAPVLEDQKLIGLFVDPEGQPVAACTCDLDFAAYGGAALSMMPKGGAEDAAENDDLSESMKENVYEIMNICSRLLMSDDTPHLKLGEMYVGASELPADAAEVLKAAEGHSHFDVKIPNYGVGKLAIIST